MAGSARRIPIDKNSELGRMLDEACQAGQSVELEVNGYTYHFSPRQPGADDPWANYDPERVRQALPRSAGALKGVDRDKLMADLKEQRAVTRNLEDYDDIPGLQVYQAN